MHSLASAPSQQARQRQLSRTLSMHRDLICKRNSLQNPDQDMELRQFVPRGTAHSDIMGIPREGCLRTWLWALSILTHIQLGAHPGTAVVCRWTHRQLDRHLVLTHSTAPWPETLIQPLHCRGTGCQLVVIESVLIRKLVATTCRHQKDHVIPLLRLVCFFCFVLLVKNASSKNMHIV